MGFLKWGIQRVDNFEKDLALLEKRLGYIPLSWRQVIMAHPSKDGLLWRFPDPDVLMASSLRNVQAILVTDYEQVVVLRYSVQLGPEREILTPGLYVFDRLEMRDQLEFIWTTTREFQLRWGVSSVLTQDRIDIGASGYYRAAIEDPERFLFNVAGHAQVYTEDQLSTFIRPTVTGILRDLMGRKTVMDFQLARQEFIDACREMLQPVFERWGLEFRGFSIENQHIPEQFLQAAAGRTLISMEKEAQLEGAKVDVLLAQLEASKLLAMKKVDLDLMREEQRIGLDPLELKRIEAVETLAANPSPGSLIDARAPIANQLLGQASSPLAGSVNVVPADSTQLTPPMLPSDHESADVTSSPTDAVSTGGTRNREQIEEMLDTLEERFLNKEISEQTYLMIRERWMKKLEKLP